MRAPLFSTFDNAVELGVAGSYHRLRHMHGKRGLVGDVGFGNIDRQDQHGDATL